MRGRVGAAFDRLLVYVTGGGGWGEFTSFVTVGGFGPISGSANHFLYNVGGSAEFGITDNLSARIEYLYLDSGNLNLATTAAFTMTGRVKDNLVRAGLNLRLPIN